MVSKPLLDVNNITARYGNLTIIEDITFSLTAGDIAMIIGPNGSGKTTLLKTILGLVPRASGTATIAGHDTHMGCRDVGYVPQRFSFDTTFPITVEEFLKLAVWYQRDRSKIMQAIKKSLAVVGMANQVRQMLGTLSGGQLQRVLIARAILHQPKLLVLDEPAAGIDITGESNFYELIKRLRQELNMTVLMVSHDIDAVFQYATQVLCLNKKLLCFGAPRSVLDHQTFHKLYGKDVVLYQHGGTANVA